jgi:hypothetical protein
VGNIVYLIVYMMSDPRDSRAISGRGYRIPHDSPSPFSILSDIREELWSRTTLKALTMSTLTVSFHDVRGSEEETAAVDVVVMTLPSKEYH